MSGKVINIVIGVAILIAVVLAYFFFFSSPSGSDTALQVSTPVSKESEELSRQFLSLLLKTKEMKVDTKIFNDPVFKSLKDFNTVIQEEPKGRVNPFAPIGSSAGQAGVTASTTRITR